MFNPIEVEITPNTDFRPIEVAVETEAAPVAAEIEQPYTGESEE